MSDYRSAKILISPGVANSLIIYKNKAEKSTITWYQSAIGAFMWPAMHSRPNLAYSVGLLSHFRSNLRLVHVQLVRHIL